MKFALYFSILFFLVSCTEKGNVTPDKSSRGSFPLKNQLYLFQETVEPGQCSTDSIITGEGVHAGAMYLTSKGNVIFNIVNFQEDTVRYQYGTYTTTDTSLSYHLTAEYYYPGQWDAKWNVPDPDYKKGKTRKIDTPEVTLFRTKHDSLTFFRPYTELEKVHASTGDNGVKPQGIDYWRYHETEDMKFYSWFYEQVPVLADL